MTLSSFSEKFIEFLKESGYQIEIDLYADNVKKYYIHVNYFLDSFLWINDKEEIINIGLSFHACVSPEVSAKLVSRIYEDFGPKIKINIEPIFDYDPEDEGVSLLKGEAALNNHTAYISSITIEEFLKQEESFYILMNSRGHSC